MEALTKKEIRQQKKQQKKKEKALAKRRKKIENELNWCIAAVYFLVFLTATVVNMIHDGSLRERIKAGRKNK